MTSRPPADASGLPAQRCGVAPLRLTALIVAFTGTVAMWWIYFHRAEGAAFELLDDGGENDRDEGGLGRLATYTLYGMIAGLIVAAVGDELVIAHPWR